MLVSYTASLATRDPLHEQNPSPTKQNRPAFPQWYQLSLCWVCTLSPLGSENQNFHPLRSFLNFLLEMKLGLSGKFEKAASQIPSKRKKGFLWLNFSQSAIMMAFLLILPNYVEGLCNLFRWFFSSEKVAAAASSSCSSF